MTSINEFVVFVLQNFIWFDENKEYLKIIIRKLFQFDISILDNAFTAILTPKVVNN